MTVRVLGDDGLTLFERVVVADRPLARMKGLLGRRTLAPGEGLLLRPASSIHMWFMRFAIDAVFLDEELRVLAVSRNVRPWRVAAKRGANCVLEVAAGQAAGVKAGDRLRIVSAKARSARSVDSDGRTGEARTS